MNVRGRELFLEVEKSKLFFVLQVRQGQEALKYLWLQPDVRIQGRPDEVRLMREAY